MQNRFLIGLFISLLTSLPSISQAEESNEEVQELDSVSVIGENRKDISEFSGASCVHYGEEIKSHTDVSSFIAQQTAFVIKQNGNGMMSTLSLRGTAASHTATQWNGISISSLTMGQTDFSTLPTFFFDRMAIYPGGESAIFGDGAIGGAVQLSSVPTSSHATQENSDLKWNLSAETDWGSFGKRFHGFKFYADKNRVTNRTALFHSKCDNDYSFSFRGETHEQKNAQYKNFGLLNETSVRIGKGSSFLKGGDIIGADVWFTKFSRDIQPMMQNNEDPTKYEDISDQSVKIVLRQDRVSRKYDLHNKIAWSNDREKYQNDLIATHDISIQSGIIQKVYVSKLAHRKDEGTRRAKHVLNWGTGGDIHYIKPEVDAYKEGMDEWRGSLYIHTKFNTFPNSVEGDSSNKRNKPSGNISIHANIRKNFVSGTSIPLSLSFGIGTYFIKRERTKWESACSFGRNSKSPTLNDRYWGDQANKGLLPETAFNMEWKNRLFFNGPQRNYTQRLGISLYRNNVDNWIMWMPRGNVWKPTNIENVTVKGLEVESVHKIIIAKTEQEIAVSYNNSFTEIKKGFDDMRPFVGHQMPLLPQNTLSGNWNLKIKNWNAGLNGRFTGERSSSDIYDILPGYILFDLSCEYEFDLCKKKGKKHGSALSFNGKIRNLFGVNYQNLPYRSMPGRNFSIGVKWRIGG